MKLIVAISMSCYTSTLTWMHWSKQINLCHFMKSLSYKKKVGAVLKTKSLMSAIEKETLNTVFHFKDMKQFENYNLTYIS